MIENGPLAEKAIQSLVERGVRRFAVCAGARNAPLVWALQKSEFETFEFFDERSAAFFALGRIKADQKPFAVVTTSGTAVGELLPAVMEAYHSALPLVVVSADRPKNFRGTGAPQTTNQVGIFSHFAESVVDWDGASQPSFGKWSGGLPLHLNICFTEPLAQAKTVTKISGPQRHPLSRPAPEEFFASSRRPLVVLGQIPHEWRSRVKNILLELGHPIYAEGLSGLREDRDLSPLIVKSGERFLSAPRTLDFFDSLIRIGGVPTVRLWRDLEDRLAHWPVLSIHEPQWSGLGRLPEPALHYEAGLLLIERSLQGRSQQSKAAVTLQIRSHLAWDGELTDKLQHVFETLPDSEPSLVRRLSQILPEGTRVFLGNSLPIREWDLAAIFQDKKLVLNANRGLNGIDGVISTFLGWSKPERENVLVLGDLSALYDLSALWPIAQGHLTAPCKIIVINNGGGRIFHRMFKNPAFENEHDLDFSKWAEMFKVPYFKGLPSWSDLPSQAVVELNPDQVQTQKFYDQYEELFL